MEKRGRKRKGNKNKKEKKQGIMVARGRVSILDKYGNEFGGSIRTVGAYNFPNFANVPFAPVGDAKISTCQEVNNFTNSNNIVAGTASGAPTIAAQGTVNTYFTIAFALYDLAQYTSWTALFDQYRIDKVQVKFIPQGTVVDLHTTVTLNAENPSIYLVLDFDDATLLSSFAGVQEYDNVETTEGGGGFFVTIFPSVTPSVYSAGAFSGYAVERAGWIDCANASVPHYGLKGMIEALYPSSTGNFSWTIQAKYYFSFRNVR
jgi:hypothetical protein